MRQIAIVVAFALVITGIMIWGGPAVVVGAAGPAGIGPVSPSIDVQQITRDAKPAPEEQFVMQ